MPKVTIFLIASCEQFAKDPKRLFDSFDEGTQSAIAKDVSRDGRKLAELALNVHCPAILARVSEALKEPGVSSCRRY